MKKRKVLTLLLTASVALASCGKAPVEETTEVTTEETTTTVAETTAATPTPRPIKRTILIRSPLMASITVGWVKFLNAQLTPSAKD